MLENAQSPAYAPEWLRAAVLAAVAIQVVGIMLFGYFAYRRMLPLLHAQRDPRVNRIGIRVRQLLKFWLAQWKQPRYLLAGVLHIVIFAGFLVLSVRSLQLVLLGFS